MPATSICDLPTELISIIFIYTFEVSGIGSRRCWNIRDVQWLASVCKHWLSIVLGTPELWPLIDSDARVDILRIVLQRNPNGLLGVRLQLPNRAAWLQTDHEPEPPARITQFLELASQHTDRWQHVDLSGFVGLSKALAVVERAHSIKTLSIHVKILTNSQKIISLSRLSALKSLNLYGVAPDWSCLPALPVLEDFSMYKIALPPLESLYSLLLSTPKLESITAAKLLTVDGNPGQSFTPPEPALLPALARIILTQPTHPSFLGELLSMIRTSKPLALTASEVSVDVLRNPHFHHLAKQALTGVREVLVKFGYYMVEIFSVEPEAHLKDAPGSIGEMIISFGQFSLDTDLLNQLGSILSSVSLDLAVSGFDVTDRTLDHNHPIAPLLQYTRSISVNYPERWSDLLNYLCTKRMDDSGIETLIAPRLERISFSYNYTEDESSVITALKRFKRARCELSESEDELPFGPPRAEAFMKLSAAGTELAEWIRREAGFPDTLVEALSSPFENVGRV